MHAGDVIGEWSGDVAERADLPSAVGLGSFLRGGGAWRLAGEQALLIGLILLLVWACCEAVLPRGENPMSPWWALIMPIGIVLSATVTVGGAYARGGGLPDVADQGKRVRVAIAPKHREEAVAVLSAPPITRTWTARRPTVGIPVVATPLRAYLGTLPPLAVALVACTGLVVLVSRTPSEGMDLAACMGAVAMGALVWVPAFKRVTFRVEPGRLEVVRRGWFGRESTSAWDLSAASVEVDGRAGVVQLREDERKWVVLVGRAPTAMLAIARAAVEFPAGDALRK